MFQFFTNPWLLMGLVGIALPIIAAPAQPPPL
jgi:hypothetical protein